MAEQSNLFVVKPTITYPREAQAGKTYLMTIDLQPEEGFEWQYDEEEYPIYCTVNSELFDSKPIEEPVVVLHRFGGSYGAAKFYLQAIQARNNGKITVELLNRWGVLIKTIELHPVRVWRTVTKHTKMLERVVRKRVQQNKSEFVKSQEVESKDQVPQQLSAKSREVKNFEVGTRVLDTYLLKEYVGSNNFSSSWKAVDTVSEQQVTVKVLHDHHALDSSKQRSFLQSAELMKFLYELGCPNITKIIYFPESTKSIENFDSKVDKCYFITEFVGSRNLHSITLNGDLSSQEKIIEIIENVSKTLVHAHDQGIIHRNVRPESILLNDDGVTYLDFCPTESTTETPTSASGARDYIYSAPEVINSNEIGRNSDVYSLGMTTIFCLYGKRLPVNILLDRQKFVDEELNFTPQFKAALLEAIELDKSKRFSSVKEFFESLSVAWKDRNNQILPPESGDPLQLDHSSPRYRIGKFTVTNTEFNQFVREGGYENEGYKWWSSEGQKYWERYKARIRENPYSWPPSRERSEDESIDHQKYWRDKRYNHPAQPVVGVSWFEAEAYCNWLQARLRKHNPAVWNDKVVRLPTEAEWEYAARGNTSDLYTWGNNTPTPVLANFNSKQGSPDVVGKHPEGASRFSGCHDMCGNVWEWCKDVSDREDDPECEYSRVIKGGCFFDNNDVGGQPDRFIYVTTRDIRRAGYRHTAIGFRIVVEFELQPAPDLLSTQFSFEP